jgi:outer membrane murein-binding lipoprotein Lpp
MNSLALIALLFATPLVQAAPEPTGLDCKSALTGLAAAAHVATVATDAADELVARVDELQLKVDACRKEKGKGSAGCAKLEERLKAAEEQLGAAEDELTVALEGVDAAYDEFDVACSWDDPDTSVQVRHLRPSRAAGSPVVRVSDRSPGTASRRR